MEYVTSFLPCVYGCVRARAVPRPAGGTAWGLEMQDVKSNGLSSNPDSYQLCSLKQVWNPL